MNNTIEITLHPDRPARPQIEAALANIQPCACPHHPDELLKFNRQMTLNQAFFDPVVASGDFVAVFNRCPDCPHNSMDGIEVRDCAAEMLGIKSLRLIDSVGKPLPWASDRVEISPDISPNAVLEAFVDRIKRIGMKCGEKELAFNKMRPNMVRNLGLHLDFASCPACVLERMGLTPDEARASFNNFVCDPPILGQYLRACQEYAAEPKGVLLLLGGTGTGKTHLGASIMRERICHGNVNRLVFFRTRHLLDQHWQSIRPVSFRTHQPESPLEQCQRADLLMIDELTLLPTHFDAEGFLLDLFEERLGNYRPTIITSNLNRDELEAAIGSRLFDRLRRAAAAVLEFGFESKRPQFNKDYLNQNPR